jgi:hypothetical protein
VPTPTPTPAAKSPSKINLSALSSGPALKLNFDFSTPLENWQIDAINSGGVIDLRYLKVKPISLRKK